MKIIHTTLSTQICLKKYFNKHIQNGRQGMGGGDILQCKITMHKFKNIQLIILNAYLNIISNTF